MRMKVIVTGIFALITISLCTGIAQAQSLGTYGDYSRMFEKSAGQFWSGNWRNQWAWEPQGGGVSYIRWGDPDQWPLANYEKFEKSDDGKWILLDGFGSNTSFLKQRVTKEQIGDVSCRNMKPFQMVEGGKQHYVKWDIQSEPFCLEAWGKSSTRTLPMSIFITSRSGSDRPALGVITCITRTKPVLNSMRCGRTTTTMGRSGDRWS
ncbi:hypothetical protein [Bacillus gobiensis]|uniref:hypothetical protein n=1 Tax=Bacillus gobiensis TaxID=1441095 RepID=UPI003D1D3F27